ncbi:hypothetical protein DWV00_17760 [Trinickia dinghuensis]|uniref:Uncharacterized protein n=1 Tax=Trinickia dinghuensis TaxID=2291023 RepID=A0A3D8JXU8_9BURK|nr:hypothetical protein DWV00_17760 [Trinickia dinghuensis]
MGIRADHTPPAYSPEELAEAAESDRIDRILAAQGVQAEADDGRPIRRRKFSELRGFNRKSFDADQYARDLGRKRQ